MASKKWLLSVMPTFDRVRCSSNPFRRRFEIIPFFYWKVERWQNPCVLAVVGLEYMNVQNAPKAQACQLVSKKASVKPDEGTMTKAANSQS